MKLDAYRCRRALDRYSLLGYGLDKGTLFERRRKLRDWRESMRWCPKSDPSLSGVRAFDAVIKAFYSTDAIERLVSGERPELALELTSVKRADNGG